MSIIHLESWDDEAYLSKDQRTVHIFSSGLETDEPGKLRLIAGFFNRDYTAETVFKWLYSIFIERENQIRYFNLGKTLLQHGAELFPFALVRFANHNEDPFKHRWARKERRGLLDLSSEIEKNHVYDWTRRQDPFPDGHYYMIRKKGPRYSAFLPEEDKMNCAVVIARRPTDGGDSEPEEPSHQGHSSGVRQDVRVRDQRCRITDAPAISRKERGPNFAGLEVAHIYPIAWAAKKYVHKGFGDSDLEEKLSSKKTADYTGNALLMRADLHKKFDDYQFGWDTPLDKTRTKTYVPSPADFKLHIFERDGGYGDKQAERLQLKQDKKLLPPSLTPIDDNAQEQALKYLAIKKQGRVFCLDDVDVRLLEHHFMTALLWHVRGAGTTVQAK
ncbi:hypothetical protein D9613_009315 [Agrocybe pediades]|uniref:HNH nuclease domain-containing protein n=1 Tax=Agrocybe pediades TaxID=84607 RepID=A0A8H4VUA4_9AGAR|nr:hypothetical protein D9613_009315 [Agrocybe pediades]